MAQWRKRLKEEPPAIRVIVAAACGVLLVTGAAVAATYEWVGDEDPPVWGDGANWSLDPPFCSTMCYPHTTDDEAVFNDNGGFEVQLDDDYTIDDVTIQQEDVFGVYLDISSSSAQTARELSCDTLVIHGYAEVTVTQNVTVTARSGE